MEHTELWLKNRIFAAAGNEVCAKLAQEYVAKSYDPGVVIARTGDTVDWLYIVLGGTVRLFHDTPDGRNITVKLLSAPSIFCENEVLHRIRLLINIAALDEVLLSAIPAAEFRALLERHPQVAVAFAYHVTGAFAVATISQKQALISLEARIATVLLSYCDIYGRTHPDGILIDLPLSQQQIADMAGAVERSVTRVISAWQKAGLLSKRGKRFLLQRREHIETIAQPFRNSLNYSIGMPLTHLFELSPIVRAKLEVIRVPLKLNGCCYIVERELIIGCGEHCGLQLPHETVSPQHCRIFQAKTGGRYWVEDLDSLNGTYVNGRPVKLGVLRDDDLVELGAAKLRVTILVEQPRTARHVSAPDISAPNDLDPLKEFMSVPPDHGEQ